ncbi:MAG: Leukotoxin export protein LtxD [Chroococcopsis gigantea SAG 12.99]|nr:HlyD family efflux transporter periplasmic adaptor subunit [Chlorogloea purpurea SAG 13.99]MDV3001203.1 Leukotoxin export protein LtxD [Chroococcopsis gigantea SAG 12.99]
MNGNNGNGRSLENDKLAPNSGKSPIVTREKKEEERPNLVSFRHSHEQAVILKQSPIWSRGVIWAIVGVTMTGIIWSAFAKIEQVVSAKGQLKPQGKVKEVQSPTNGVVKAVYVKDGDRVKAGQTLVVFDTMASKAELQSYQRIRQAADQENKFYGLVLNDKLTPHELETSIASLKIPLEIANLVRNRSTIVTENQVYKTQLGDTANNGSLNSSDQARLSAGEKEATSRSAAAQLEVSQIQKQLAQTQVQLADTSKQLLVDKQLLAQIQSRNDQTAIQLKESLSIEQKILKDIEPLGDEGAIARYQINKQKQSVSDRLNTLQEQQANGKIEYDKQSKEVQNRLTEIARLQQEEKRYSILVDQAREKSINTSTLTEKDLRDKVADNQKRVSEIDSQLSKIIVDNNKKIAELDGQISRAQQTIKYQELKAPIDGVVFDLKAAPGFVPQPSQAEALMKIVPAGCPDGTVSKDGCLVAEVDVTNEDIGFVNVGQKADIRIDSFSYSEYGDIKGKVINVGSDALPPDQDHRFYRFPVKVSLNSQSLNLNGGEKLPLQSGMSVSVNIKVNENRTVMSLFTELFTKKVDSLKTVR